MKVQGKACTLTLILIVALSSIPFVGADWSMFRADPAHTGAGTADGVISLNPIWSQNISSASYLTLAGGVLYCNSVVYVLAVNATDGKELWSSRLSNYVESSPAIVNGVVYTADKGGSLYALNASNGAQIWTNRLGDSIFSSPAVLEGVVYVGFHDGVCALNSANGAIIWKHLSGPVTSSPAVVNGILYVGEYDDALGSVGRALALDASTGNVEWGYPFGAGVSVSPTVVDGRVLFGSEDGAVYALSTSGSLLWKYTTGGKVKSSPSVFDGVVYIGSDDHNFYALNASNGEKIWSYPTGNIVRSSPAVAGGVVYIGSEDWYLYALDAKSGNPVWRYPDHSEPSPIVDKNILYIVTERGIQALGNPLTPTLSPSQTAMPTTASTLTPPPSSTDTNKRVLQNQELLGVLAVIVLVIIAAVIAFAKSKNKQKRAQ
jgi:outer membrane protein assembly factor BamB